MFSTVYACFCFSFFLQVYHNTNLTVACPSVSDVRAEGHQKSFDPN